jgi:hypothetical protein
LSGSISAIGGFFGSAAIEKSPPLPRPQLQYGYEMTSVLQVRSR